LFPIAQLFKQLTSEDFEDLDEVRRFLFDTIASFRRTKGRGIIADYNRDRFDEYLIFTRIGDGGLGGKARGLAFIDVILKRYNLLEKFENTIITIPRTVVLSTDVFDDFMEENNLYYIALSDRSDEEIMEAFVESRLPYRIHEDLLAFINVVKNPIAVRSSSLLEDSHYQPFAGIYNTFMIPKVEQNDRLMIEMLSHAIKCVYASVYYKDSKSYMEATRNVIDQEKMAIVLQEVTGRSNTTTGFTPRSRVWHAASTSIPLHLRRPKRELPTSLWDWGSTLLMGGCRFGFRLLTRSGSFSCHHHSPLCGSHRSTSLHWILRRGASGPAPMTR
jgi:hypothetical protein